MRIRVTFQPPLPERRFWYPINAPHKSVAALGAEILTVADLGPTAQTLELELEVDGFALLPNVECGTILRDGDLVL